MPPRHTTKVVPVVRRPRGDGFDVLAFRHPLAGCQLVKGSVEHDESIEAAAERKLLEETGYRDPIGPCVRRRETVYQAGDVPMSRWLEDYFVVYSAGGPLQADAWTEEERRNIRDWRWWSVAELHAQSEQLLPIWLPDEVERCVVRAESGKPPYTLPHGPL